MAVFILDNSLQMPSADLADVDGLLAIGGDLSTERLVNAYEMGIFPWYNQGEEIMWWSPDPRCVLYPSELKISKSSRNLLNRNSFEISYNKSFEEVINGCKTAYRKGQDGTWIGDDMVAAYIELHRLGIAHSVEVWKGNSLIGGLYGLKLGDVFFGESMFSTESNASKVGFIHWVKKCENEGVVLIDCQQSTQYLLSLGAREIDRSLFLKTLRENS